MTHPMHLALWPIILILVLAARMTQLQESAGLNGLALQATAACFRPERAAFAAEGESWRAQWLAAATAHCRDRQARARAAWRRVLAHSAQRIDALRSFLPTESALARFAATRHPQNAEAHFWLGDARREADDSAGAIAAYEQALALDPSGARAWLYLGRLYEQGENWQAARAAYEQACRYGDPGGHGCRDAAAIYLQQEQYEQAIEFYERALSRSPVLPREHRGLVDALLALGRSEEALPHLRILAARGDADAQQLLDELELTIGEGR